MKSETFESTEKLLIYFRGKPFSTIFQGAVHFPDQYWRIRNSGVWGQPELSAETYAVILASKELGVELGRHWSATPMNPDSFRIESTFLDGGIHCMTGNYWYHSKGAGCKELELLSP